MLVTLRQIVQEVSAATHLDDVLDIIAHRVKEALSIDACAVYLSDAERNQYVLMAADGFHQASIGQVRILAAALAERVDFLSIGTNDLTQYMLAVDRNNAQVVTPYDSLHPAILNAIHHVIKEAHLRGKPVSVCGEMAGDPAGALLLLGMGVDALSMSAASFARVKLVIRSFTQQRARSLLDEALGMEDGFAIHRLLNGALEGVGV